MQNAERELPPTEKQIKDALATQKKYLEDNLPLLRLRHEQKKLSAEIAHYTLMETRAWADLAHMQQQIEDHEQQEAEAQQQSNQQPVDNTDGSQTVQPQV